MVDANDLARILWATLPDATQSPKSFKVATILVSRDGLVLAERDAALRILLRAGRGEERRRLSSGLAKGFTNPFVLSTQGLADLNARLFPAASRGRHSRSPRGVLSPGGRGGGVDGHPHAQRRGLGGALPAGCAGCRLSGPLDDGRDFERQQDGDAPGRSHGRVLRAAALRRRRLRSPGHEQRGERGPHGAAAGRADLQDVLTIRLSGVWRDGCIPRNPAVTVAGQSGPHLDVRAGHGRACTGGITPWSLTVTTRPAGGRDLSGGRHL